MGSLNQTPSPSLGCPLPPLLFPSLASSDCAARWSEKLVGDPTVRRRVWSILVDTVNLCLQLLISSPPLFFARMRMLTDEFFVQPNGVFVLAEARRRPCSSNRSPSPPRDAIEQEVLAIKLLRPKRTSSSPSRSQGTTGASQSSTAEPPRRRHPRPSPVTELPGYEP